MCTFWEMTQCKISMNDTSIFHSLVVDCKNSSLNYTYSYYSAMPQLSDQCSSTGLDTCVLVSSLDQTL